MKDLVEVEVMVPRPRLGDFYTFFGRWLADASTEQDANTELTTRPASKLAPWTNQRTQMWTRDGSYEDRLKSARAFYRSLTPTARQFLDLLLDSEEMEAAAHEIVSALGLESTHSLAGSLSSFGFTAKRIGRLQPFEWRVEENGETTYFIPAREIGELFREARAS